jgi:hypothetical protein
MKHLILTVCLGIAALGAQGAQTTTPIVPPATAAPEQAAGFSGKVVETTNAASYTYVLVDTGARKAWVAAPAFPVKVGDSVMVGTSMPMANYHSKTLNRDFEVVYFTGGVMVNGMQPKVAGQPAGLPKGHPPITGGTAKSNVDLSGITKAEGGQTVAEIVAGKDKLNGQTARVRGRVVKYNAGIMGRNWLHIRDGSGSEGSNDLLVTTDAAAKIGDTVLVSGKVAINQDFGAGYKYSVVVENAKVVVE